MSSANEATLERVSDIATEEQTGTAIYAGTD